MQSKKIAGLVVLIIGAVVVMYAIHLMQRTHEAKRNAMAVASPLQEEPLGAIVGEMLNTKAGENEVKDTYLLMGGMALLMSGGGIILLFRDKS